MRRQFLSFTVVFLLSTLVTFSQQDLFNKGLKEFDAKQYDQCIITFRQVVESSPRNHAAFYNLGLCYYNLKRYDQAGVSFREATIIKPDYTKAYIFLGNSLDLSNQYPDAVIAYNKAISLEPNNASAYYELGIAHKNQKKYSDAEKALKKSAELAPESINSKIELGNTYVNLRAFPSAISTFNQAIILAPGNPSVHLGLGNAYYNDRRYVESIPHYKRAAELLPTWATAQLYLADAYLNSKNYPEAVTAFKLAIGLDPKLADAYYGLGLTYFNQKNNALAREQVEKLRLIDAAKANQLSEKIGVSTSAVKSIAAPTPKPVAKTLQRAKDESDVAKMSDPGFDAAYVTKVSSIRDRPSATGKLLISLKRGDILSVVSRTPEKNWYQVVDEKTGLEGWINGDAVVIKLTNDSGGGPPLLESGVAKSLTADPTVLVSNLEEKTTLSLRINGTLYKIPPKSTKSISLPSGKISYYGWSPGIRPTNGSSVLEKGKEYSWTFKINRR